MVKIITTPSHFKGWLLERFRQSDGICPICKFQIRDFDPTVVFTARHGRTVNYCFIHERCVYGEKEKNK